MLNLNIINKEPQDWNREDWQDAYNLYCIQNIYGPKTKKEYYHMVLSNFERINSVGKPLSESVRKQWMEGWKNAVAWAKEHKCNINGEPLENSEPKADLESLQNDVREIQWQLMNK